jgi:palmitoyltransferase ZDHHC4
MDSTAWLLAFLAVYVCFVCLLFYTILFGASARHESGLVGRVHKFITVTLAKNGHVWLSRICCPRAENPETRTREVLERVAHVFEKYIMSGVYIGMLFGGLVAANTIVLSRLHELETLALGVSPCPRTKLFCMDAHGLFTVPPRTNPDAVYIYGVLACGSWLAVYLANPGIVNAETFQDMKALYPYDQVIFVSGKNCPTCKQPKLPRTKHDSLIGACIARYDHFCGWTGNAIGLYNTNRFCLFLLVHLTMLIHGSALCAEIVYARMLSLIDGGYTYIPTNERITRMSIVIAFSAEPTLCLFLFVLILTALVVGGFLFFHVSLISSNITTSESAKWSPVNKACADYLKEHGRSYGSMLQQLAEKEALETASPLQHVPPFQADGLPANIYDRGLLSNVLEVFFPTVFVQQSRARAERVGAKGE